MFMLLLLSSCAKYEKSQPYKVKGVVTSKSFEKRYCKREYTYGMKWNSKLGMRWTTNCYGPYYRTNIQSEKGLKTFSSQAAYDSYKEGQEVFLTCIDTIKVEKKEIQGSTRKREIRTVVRTGCNL